MSKWRSFVSSCGSAPIVALVLVVVTAWRAVGAEPPRAARPADATRPADGDYEVGVASVDITPDYPIRLSGFGFRRTESEGVTQRIQARAIAIQQSWPPLVAVTVDNLGVPAAVQDAVLQGVNKRLGPDRVLPAERLAICSSHTHTAPMLRNVAPTLYSQPIPDEHQRRIDRYTDELTERLVQLVLDAIANCRPAGRMSYGVGRVGFAKNRRAGGGPVDHDLPLLLVRDRDGRPRAIWVTYACHCVTLSNNRISGDWVGYARAAIERQFPGAVALVSIGCGADQNPDSGVTGDKADIAAAQGEQIAAEVRRLVGGFLAPVHGPLTATRRTLELPLADLPARATWEELGKRPDAIGYHARVNLARLDRGEALKTKIDYPVSTWTFGDSLAQVFLPGEVVVDYAVRLKRELDNQRVWVHAYANDAPCYIPSERILREGGYEGGGAMVYYDVPVPFRAGLEDRIVATAVEPLQKSFGRRIDVERTGGSLPPSPQQAVAMLRTKPGLQADLVAAEPLTVDPVAIDFGPDGRLWVAEMHDYPSGLDGKFGAGGRVRTLTDEDGDGVYDRSVVFLDKLPFPTGITVWRRGVLVCAAPDVLYAEDTDGDGRADVTKKVLSGFGVENFQARVNSLCYGLDGWVYGSCGLFGGEIHATGQDGTTALGNRDFRFQPDSGRIEPATGRTQQSRVRNDWDDWFGCDNSNLARHYVLADHYLRRNSHVAPPPSFVNLTPGPDGARLYSPLSGAQRFKLSGAPNQVTAACGLGVYRDELLGAEYSGDLFVCEPVNLVVHRRKLHAAGSSFVGVRAEDEQQNEFLSSTDNWFRPVQTRTGPDGSLWIVDMCRHVIEHPRWIPAEDLAKLDVRAGDALGRIYRVRPTERTPRVVARLDRLDGPGLVAALDSPNGPQRDLAGQMLAWNTSDDARGPLVPSLVKLAASGERPAARLHALAVLEAFDEVTPDVVRTSLSDAHPGVRRLACRLAEPYLDTEAELREPVQKLLDDPDAQVRLQAACSLGQLATVEVGEALAQAALKHSDDPYLTGAVFSGLRSDAATAALNKVLATDGEVRSPENADPDAKARDAKGRELLVGRLVSTVVATADAEALASILNRLGARSDRPLAAWQWNAVANFLETIERRGKPLAALLDADDVAAVEKLFGRAREVAGDRAQETPARVAAMRLLGRHAQDRAADLELLVAQIAPQSSPAIRRAAIGACGRIDDPRTPPLLTAHWSQQSPDTQAAILETLLSRPAWRTHLVEQLETRRIPASQIDAARRQQLLTQTTGELRKRAEKALAGTVDPNRRQVIDKYRAALDMRADAERGRQVFTKRCAACHRLGMEGVDVGPNLGALANKTADYLLSEILDPNRNVDSRYLQYVAANSSGQTFAGILASESATSITLRGQEGKQWELLREDLEQLSATGKSLMPEGLERDIAPSEMADLIALLTRSVEPPKTFAGNKPETVRPDAAGFAALRASQAEIRGDELVFETPFRNLGYWHRLNDHATWTLETSAGGEFDMYLDYSCANESAGNTFAIDGFDAPVRGTIAATGGWDKYARAKVGTVKVSAGRRRVTMRPEGMGPRGALADLRTILLAPKGQAIPPALLEAVAAAPADVPAPVPPKTPAELARRLLDDGAPAAERQKLVESTTLEAAALVVALTADLAPGTPEEYRRIPWIWRVSIAAGKQNDARTLAALLDVSLPRDDQPLRDWQAVVIGGGVINGISQQGVWPRPRLDEILKTRPELAPRWTRSLRAAAAMCDDEKVPKGTRYDALRMIALDDWKQCRPQLEKYLAPGTHAELQMGAVSGLADVDAPEVGPRLLKALPHLTAGNRDLALEAFARSDERRTILAAALEQGQVDRAWFKDAARRERLLATQHATLAERLKRALAGP